MSFQPVLPSGGLQGWMYLQRTYETQLETFSLASQMQRDVAYFKETIGSITSAEDLVSDRRLREVSLGAFGLQADLPNIHFVKTILSDGTGARDALSNRLADTRYRQFSSAFGFGPGEVRQTGDAQAMADLADRYIARQFEESVGTQDETMRIALNGQRELSALAAGDGTAAAKWYSVLGQPPLRALFETALGLPPSFGQADLDLQVQTFQKRLQSTTGDADISQFADPDRLDRFLTTYHARAQIAGAGVNTSPAATALLLLGG